MRAAKPEGWVSPEAIESFRRAAREIVERATAWSLARPADTAQHGEDARRLIASGLRYTTRMLEAALSLGEAAILEDQLRWARERLPHDGVSPTHLVGRLRAYGEAVRELLPREHAEQVAPFVNWMVHRLEHPGAEQGAPRA